MAMPSFPPVQSQPQLKHVDRVEVSETFAHSLRRMTFDGANLHMEMVVNRMDDPDPSKPPTGATVTVARLVMPLVGALNLHASLSQLVQSLQTQGALKPVAQGPQTVN
jgi:hypothetical protein